MILKSLILHLIIQILLILLKFKVLWESQYKNIEFHLIQNLIPA